MAVEAVYDAAGPGDIAALSAAVDALLRSVDMVSSGDPNRGLYLAVAGYAFGQRFQLAGQLSDLRTAVEWSEEAAAATPSDDPQRYKVLSQLAHQYMDLFKAAGDLADLNAGIERAEQCLKITAPDEPRRAEKLFNLGLSYQRRFKRTGDIGDQDSMIERYEQALDAPHVDTLDRAAVLSALRTGYMNRFLRGGARKDLDAAVDRGERALAEKDADQPSQQAWLVQLACIYQERFDLTGALDDVNAMIRCAEQAVAAGDTEDPNWPHILRLAAESYRRRFDRTGAPADIDTCVERLEQAVAAIADDEPQRARWLSNLGLDHLSRFQLTGEPEALRASFARGEQALAGIPAGHPDHAVCLGNLAMAYDARYELTGNGDDLNTGIELDERALALVSEGDRRRRALLVNLATGYSRRHMRTGAHHDLDASIELGEQALTLLGPDGADRSACLSNIAVSYRRRYEHSGATADLDAAVELGEQAVQVLPADHPQRSPRLGNLALAYADRFRRAGAPADLDTAIECGEQAIVDLPLKHDNRGLAQSNLSSHYLERFEVSGDPADLELSIERAEQALAAISAGHPRWASFASTLAGAYLCRYRHAGTAADLDIAVEYMERVVAATPPGAPEHMDLLSNLAVAYRERAAHGPLPAGVVSRLVESGSGPTAAAPVSRASAQYNIGLLALENGAIEGAAAMFRAAVEALPQCAPRALDWSDQAHQIAGSRGMIGDAVATHLAINDVVSAVELAELGRGILLSNQLNTRTDIAALTRSAPELATEFDQLRTEWDARPPAAFDRPSVPAAAAWLASRREMADRWDQLLHQIRQLPEFSDFLAPPRIADLQHAAAGGAVVLVNVGQPGCDAVLLRPSSLTCVRLDKLTLTDVRSRASALVGLEDRGHSAWVTPPRGATLDLLAWLWETVVEPVLAALEYHVPPHAGEPLPRVWWVPTGVLSLLPLHAAGLPGGPSALDRVVSSYASTIRTLRSGQQRRPADTRTQLTVAMQHTTGLPDLPGTAAEAAQLRARYPDTLGLADAKATVGAVLAALPHASWAHFACHATSHPLEPSRSGLHLHDAVLSVPEISRLRMSTGELAYLSACSTGQGSVFQADEAIHSASAFQLAGYRHVVATLWPVNDTIAASTAHRFYQLLGNSPTAEGAATALHQATGELRDRFPADPNLWAPFVHCGP